MEDIIVTPEMEQALDIVKNSTTNLFITGKAGTGKTTFLKYLRKNCEKQYIVTAPTGVAAINAGGVTLHRMFGIPFKPISPIEDLDYKFTENTIELLLRLQVLIIDEVSMVRPDILDVVDRKLRWVRGNDKPFGGVQLVMFGDLFQLPPVIRSEEKEMLEAFYSDYFFFNALVWKKSGFQVIELDTVFRQTDETFINILNHIRNYQVNSDDLDILSETKDKLKSEQYDDEYIHICTHKKTVEEINKTLLGEATWNSKAVLVGKFNESSVTCDLNLKLRVGARVMAICNNSKEGYYNGMLGNVVGFVEDKVLAKMDNGRIIKFEQHKWTNNQFTLKDGNIISEEIGSCTQFPLTLAWAITIHKSQGLTFNKVVLHISRTFCSGQLYVALSRCRTLDGIVCDAYITKRMIIPEHALTDFERAYKEDNNWYGKRIVDENNKN